MQQVCTNIFTYKISGQGNANLLPLKTVCLLPPCPYYGTSFFAIIVPSLSTAHHPIGGKWALYLRTSGGLLCDFLGQTNFLTISLTYEDVCCCTSTFVVIKLSNRPGMTYLWVNLIDAVWLQITTQLFSNNCWLIVPFQMTMILLVSESYWKGEPTETSWPIRANAPLTSWTPRTWRP